jgi:hypothetical protein
MKPIQTWTSVHQPEASLEGAADELLLLEHHLTDPKRHCPDCHRKHARTALALCKEAVQLGGGDDAAAFALYAQDVVGRLDEPKECLRAARYLRKLLLGSCAHS